MATLSLLTLALPLEGYVSTYNLTSSSLFRYAGSDIEVLPSGLLLGYTYDDSSGQHVLFKMGAGYPPIACGLSHSTTAPHPSVHLGVANSIIYVSSGSNLIVVDTGLGGAMIVPAMGGVGATVHRDDTLALVWRMADSVIVALGYPDAGGLTLLTTSSLGVGTTMDVSYGITSTSDGNFLVAFPNRTADSLNLVFVRPSSSFFVLDSARAVGLPGGYTVDSIATIKALRTSFGPIIGLTLRYGGYRFPALLLGGDSYRMFVMDTVGLLTDIHTSSDGLVVSIAEDDRSYVQVVPLPIDSGPSPKGAAFWDVEIGGSAEFSVGHYVSLGILDGDSILRLVKSDLITIPSDGYADRRIWNPLDITLASSSPSVLPTSASLAPTMVSCSPLPITATPVSAADTTQPTLVSYPTDDVIRAYDTLVYVFSEDIDPPTFQYGVSVSALGASRAPLSYTSLCTGATCYLIISAYGAESVAVSLTAFITDTVGNPLAPASRRSDTFSLLPAGPRVVFTQPDSGEIDVPLNASIGVWFSTDINPATINSYTVDITDGSISYPFTVTCPLANMCVLDPLRDFPPGGEIRVSFTSGVRDTYDQPLEPKVITFLTVQADTLAPRVSMTVPDSGAINVPRNFSLSVLFSKPMDTTTVASGISLMGSSSGAHTFSVFCPTLQNCVVRPLSAFLSMEVVTVRFNASILDTTGRSLIPKNVIFQVGTTYDNTPPNVRIIAPDNDTLEVYHPITEPVKAAVWDNTGILMSSWVLGSQTYHAPLSCRGLPYVASDTTCLDVSETPSGAYVLRAITYDLVGTQSVDTVILIVHDTVAPRVSFTEPANGEMAVSPYTDVSITFTEPMDTTWVPTSAVSVVVGGTSVPFSHVWNTPYVLRITFSDALPWDSSVIVSLSSLRDLSGNEMVPYTFSFRVVGETQVDVRWVRLENDSVFAGKSDSTLVVAVARSDHSITKAFVMIGDGDSIPMLPADGSYDEPEETLQVYVGTASLEPGTYPLRVKAWNPYVFGVSDPKELYVLDVPLLSPENVSVYPSPVRTSGRVRVVVGEPTTLTVEVFDLKFRRVMYDRRTYETPAIYEEPLPDLPAGVYLLRVRAGDMVVKKWFAVVKGE
ncbi:MAG: Ig-like domain-containing protein [Thermotogae bacterium]|nr:Ig-like domain-containing protein [Thermotogota bacterium]